MSEVDYTMIFSHLHKQSNAFLAARLKQLGVNVGHFPHLVCVCGNPGITQDEIAVRTRTDKSTVAKMIQQLADAGYVRRKDNPADRRSHFVFPTPKGQKILSRHRQRKAEMAQRTYRRAHRRGKAATGFAADQTVDPVKSTLLFT